jgi:hypothetical protein
LNPSLDSSEGPHPLAEFKEKLEHHFDACFILEVDFAYQERQASDEVFMLASHSPLWPAPGPGFPVA